MADNGDLQQEILQKTLREVAGEEFEGDPCVICLETITEPSIAVPCKHANFDYLCLVSWLEQQPNCPLCKTQLTAVQYDLKDPRGQKTYKVPLVEKPKTAPEASIGIRPGRGRFTGARRGPRRPRSRQRQPLLAEDPLAVRRHVYRNQLYSLRVGSNRLSQYSEMTPDQFNRDETLVSRARKWIRRELQVFSFLNPETETEQLERDRVSRPGHRRLEERRANNAEFLLEYVIAILRTVDIKGSAGQAEELLRDFVGRENAQLFLHELLAWLRSPYVSLHDWDRHVQYPASGRSSRDRENQTPGRRIRPSSRDRSASPTRPDQSLFDRVSRPRQPRPSMRRDAPRPRPNRRERPPRHLLDRYIPD
ncbi:hypothetical protein N7492_006473 [Penicillium capsulatum]|uniref:RING-type E3 ubiquitin transferase n=1 Tax=Penicillium capsulatum TaxID=69766 RepID=A0A9W9I0A5_9EURO|nr:hypothetical protein N7492_006473 [Penicillium capsulatum]KAJ6116314.1 hypothetical protein N7512_006039 [Penicillium capsulatum]